MFDVGAAGRDRAWPGPRRLHSDHRCAPRPVTVDGVAGAAPQRRRAGPLPGHRLRMYWPDDRASRPKPGKLVKNLQLRGKVEADLAKKYFPQQIAGRLKVEFPDQPEMQVSTKNDLPVAVCAIPRRPETGPDQVFENRPGSPQALPQARATQEPHPEHD